MTIGELKGVVVGSETRPLQKPLLSKKYNALPNLRGGVIVGRLFTSTVPKAVGHRALEAERRQPDRRRPIDRCPSRTPIHSRPPDGTGFGACSSPGYPAELSRSGALGDRPGAGSNDTLFPPTRESRRLLLASLQLSQLRQYNLPRRKPPGQRELVCIVWCWGDKGQATCPVLDLIEQVGHSEGRIVGLIWIRHGRLPLGMVAHHSGNAPEGHVNERARHLAVLLVFPGRARAAGD